MARIVLGYKSAKLRNERARDGPSPAVRNSQRRSNQKRRTRWEKTHSRRAWIDLLFPIERLDLWDTAWRSPPSISVRKFSTNLPLPCARLDFSIAAEKCFPSKRPAASPASTKDRRLRQPRDPPLRTDEPSYFARRICADSLVMRVGLGRAGPF